MKRFFNWQVVLALILMLSSVCVYFIQYLIFKDTRATLFYFFQDIAFLFVQVLLATFVLDKILSYRDRQSMLKKLNMVIGAFFSEVGTELLKKFSVFDSQTANIAGRLIVTNDWSKKDFYKMYKDVNSHDSNIGLANGNLEELRVLLVAKRSFMLGLLENPNLLEHETFTDLLWAVFHLTEELAQRKDLNKLAGKDSDHLRNDMKRAYILMISQWLSYMEHLKHDYPYLFSLAVRTNPFNENASAEVL